MNVKLIAFTVISLLALMTVSPFLAGNSDALETDDYVITIPGTNAPDEDVNVTIGNGKSQSWDVYVVNTSTDYLDVTFKVTFENDNISITEKPSSAVLVPEDKGTIHNFTSGVLTIAIDKLSESYSNQLVDLEIAVTNIEDKSSTHIIHVYFYVTIESIYDTAGEYNKFLGVVENKLPAPFNHPIIPSIITILFWMIVAEVLCKILAPRVARFLDSHTTDDDAERFERAISKLIAILVFLLSLIQSLDIYGAPAEIKAQAISISSIITIAVTLVIAWKVYLLVVEGILAKFDDDEDSALDLTLMPLMNMIGKIVFWIVGLASILGAIGVDLGGILISAGVVSLGITMGAQNVLSQFFSGIVILMTRPFKKGDFLKINDKVYIVKKVKIMFTEFLGWDKDMIITMPNNAVTAATIVNLTKDDEAYRLYIYFPVAYKTDLKKLEEIMLDVANKSPVVLHDYHAEPNVRLTNFLTSGLEIRLGVTVKDFNGNITAASSLRMAVYQAFLENGIEVPYNRVEINMLNDCFRGERKPGDFVED